jgi:urease accessory protein
MTMLLPLADARPAIPPPRLQRATGLAEVVLAQGARGPRLERLMQSGSAKAVPLLAPEAEIAFLNTSGGLCGGDRLAFALTLAPGVSATATTQTAERAYRAAEPAQVTVRLAVGAGGHLDWMPQETILFDGANVARKTTLDLAPGASCLMLESLVLGRTAMGETLREVAFSDWREVRQAGRPLWVEPLRLVPGALTGAATLRGARAVASVALIRAGAEDLLAPLRVVLDEAGVAAAASALPGRLMLRMMADDGWPLRRQLARALAVMRPGRALPRVWQI